MAQPVAPELLRCRPSRAQLEIPPGQKRLSNQVNRPRRFAVNTALGAGSTKNQLATTARDAVLVEDAAKIRVMGQPILEALPSRAAPYEQVDPFLLVHEGRLRLSDLANVDTKHPHRGFDNLWYVLEGSVSTGHSTGPGGAMERARLSQGALLALNVGGVHGTPRRSGRMSSTRAKPTASSEACCS